MDDLAVVYSGYPLVSSKLAKILGFKGYLPLPLSPTPRSKPELGQPLHLRECAKLRGRGKTELVLTLKNLISWIRCLIRVEFKCQMSVQMSCRAGVTNVVPASTWSPALSL